MDRYGSKWELNLIPILLPLLIYAILTIVPLIDPQKKLNKMGKKLQAIKVILTIFMSILALVIIYYAKNQSFANPNYILLLVGVLYIILGNYFQAIKANYFIGIRTPWTLESEAVWKETHKIGGKIWFVGGILIVLSSLILDEQANLILFLIVTGIITIIPMVYSYVLYRKEKKAVAE